MKNKKVIIVVLLVFIFIVLISLFIMGKGKNPIDKMTVDRITFQNQASNNLFIRTTFLNDSNDYKFANVAIDINKNSKIDNDEWVIKNHPIFVEKNSATRYTFSYPDKNIDSRKNLKATVILSGGEMKKWSNNIINSSKKSLIIDKIGKAEMGGIFFPDKKGQKETGNISNVDNFNGDLIIDTDPKINYSDNIWGYTDKYYDVNINEIENIQVEEETTEQIPEEPKTPEPERMTAKLDEMPDTNQNYNECAPTAVSNSFRYLAKKYNFNDRLPQDDKDLINEMKGYMERDFGVAQGNTLEGKKNFIKERQLPIEAHMISEEGDMGVFEKIYQELKKGQAVELSLQFYKKVGTGEYIKDGAHLVTVSGLDDFTATSGNKWITLSDPGTYEKDGKAGKDVYRVNGDELLEYWSGGLTKIRYSVAQSPIFDDEGNLVDFGDNKDYLVDDNGLMLSDQTLTRGVGKFGFFDVDFSGVGDHYVGEKFKTTIVVTNTEKQNTVRWGDDTYKVKMIGPWKLAGDYKASQNISPNNLDNRPPNIQVNEKKYRIETDFTCSEAGNAYIEYTAKINWMNSGEDEAPLEILKELGEEIVPSDEITVRSPAFRCVAKEGEDSETSLEGQVDDTQTGSVGQVGLNDNIKEASFCDGYEDNPEGKEIQVINIGGKCYPKYQFLLCQVDHNGCDVDHYHGATSDSIYALDGSELKMNQDASCYFGKVVDLKEGTIKLSPDQVATFIAESVFK